MKKWIDYIATRLFTVSGFVTSAAILLIIGFLFTEAVGKTSSMKKYPTGKSWEAKTFPCKHSGSKICPNIIPKKNSEPNMNMRGIK